MKYRVWQPGPKTFWRWGAGKYDNLSDEYHIEVYQHPYGYDGERMRACVVPGLNQRTYGMNGKSYRSLPSNWEIV